MMTAIAIACVLSSGDATAATFFSSQMSSGVGWGVNGFGSDYAATFGYDYSADGIPEAPNSQAGDVAATGLKMEANNSDFIDAAAGFTAYPIGHSFSGTYQLRFDAWMSYDVDERINGGSNGTTEFLGGGVGYNGTSADIGSGAQTIATGDGGSGSDWRAFKNGFFVSGADMPAGTRNGFDPYYSNFLPGQAPPAGQLQDAFVPGTAGSPGFQWITWLFTVVDNGVDVSRVDVDIMRPDGEFLRIVSMDCTDTSDGSPGCTDQGNIGLFYADFFSSTSSRPDLTFGLIDNVLVTDQILANPNVPEPTTLTLFGLGLLGLVVARRRGA